jgi:hypothetical protein
MLGSLVTTEASAEPSCDKVANRATANETERGFIGLSFFCDIGLALAATVPSLKFISRKNQLENIFQPDNEP